MPRETVITLKNKIGDLEALVRTLEERNASQLRFITEMNQHYLSLVQNVMVIVRSATGVQKSIARFLQENGMNQEDPSPNLPPVPLVPVVPATPPAARKS